MNKYKINEQFFSILPMLDQTFNKNINNNKVRHFYSHHRNYNDFNNSCNTKNKYNSFFVTKSRIIKLKIIDITDHIDQN